MGFIVKPLEEKRAKPFNVIKVDDDKSKGIDKTMC